MTLMMPGDIMVHGYYALIPIVEEWDNLHNEPHQKSC